MKLTEVRIQKFRNILDSSCVEIQQDVTCLVGKNESGKTAFLHSLYRLLPARPNVKFSIPEQYPAWLEKKDRLNGLDLEAVEPVCAVFLFETVDREKIQQEFGEGVLVSDSLELSRDYNNNLNWSFEVDEKAFTKYFLSIIDIPESLHNWVDPINDVSELRELTKTLIKKGKEDPEALEGGQKIEKELNAKLGGKNLKDAVWTSLETMVPSFFYFHEYSRLPYTVNIEHVLKSKPEDLDDQEHTALSLLRLAGADDEYLLNPDYERRKRELENVANTMTQDVLTYWSQNPNLRVQPDISQKTVGIPEGRKAVLDELKIRIWDNVHLLSLPFDEHSTGFQWFFSFLSAFSEYDFKNTPVVILLDEPALGLHAKAQADFLKFIDERLAPKHQVIYTTHSPFMIQPGKLERVRLVEDRGKETGALVTPDVMTTDKDTLFPLQGALGYDLVQHLFIAPHNLIVEGTSDYTYLNVISDFFKEKGGRTHLDERWSVIPVGGVDFIPTFMCLLGTHLEVTVLVDAKKGGHQRLSHLAKEGYLTEKRIITIGQILNRGLADIEDLFDPDDYIQLYNRAFNKRVKIEDLKGKDPIVSRIARIKGENRFDHGKPADILLRHRDEVLPTLSQKTLDHFENLFSSINATLPDE